MLTILPFIRVLLYVLVQSSVVCTSLVNKADITLSVGVRFKEGCRINLNSDHEAQVSIDPFLFYFQSSG